MNHLDHLLIFKPIAATCKHGHEAHLFTTDGAQCSCGQWWCWAGTRDEIDYAHDQHLTYMKQREEQAEKYQSAREISLHELEWRGPNAAACRGCSWLVYGMDSSRIVAAFSSHRENVTKNASVR